MLGSLRCGLKDSIGLIWAEHRRLCLFYCPLTLPLSLPEHVNVTTFLGSSIKSSPVAGFLPFRSFFSFTQNFPNLLINNILTGFQCALDYLKKGFHDFCGFVLGQNRSDSGSDATISTFVSAMVGFSSCDKRFYMLIYLNDQA